MSAATEPQRRYTVEEWEALDEDDDRELVDGVLVESEMVDVVHETVVTRLLVWLDAYARSVARRRREWMIQSIVVRVLGLLATGHVHR